MQDFDNASSVQDKKKAFRQYSNQFERLIEIENPSEEIDDFIMSCLIKAKKMKKEVEQPSIRSSVVDMALHNVLSEMMPEKRWEDIIGLNPQKERFLSQLILPCSQGEAEHSSSWLIYGPPGTSKSTIAKAVAFEIGYAFYYIDCTNFWLIEE